MVRDKSRDRLEPSECWNLVDYIPNILGAPLTKRGGWSYYGDTLDSLDASAAQPARVGILQVPGLNEKRTVVATASPCPGTSLTGSYTLTFKGQTTAAINFSDSDSQVQTKLENLSNIASGDVTVTSLNFVCPTIYGIEIEMKGAYANTDITDAEFTMNASGANFSGGFGSVSFNTTQNGGGVGNHVFVIDGRDNPELFNLTAGTDLGSVYGASAAAPLGPLVAYRGTLLIPSPSLSSSPTAPRKYVYPGSGTSALGGSPPGARFFAVYKDRVALASADTDTPNRIFFSGAGNAESWDTTLRWVDTSAPPIAMAALRNALLVYHTGSVERIRGDIPPGSAAANMVLEPLFDSIGISGTDALFVADEFAYWADDEGVYRTDGSSLLNFTEQGGISSYWRTQVASATQRVALSVWRGYIFISLIGGSDTFVDFLVCDIEKRAWFRFANIMAYNLAHLTGSIDELIFSNRDTSSKRLGSLSSVFTPSSSYKNDADGDAVAPVLETGVLDLDSFFLKRYGDVYLSHDVRDAASDNPTLTLSYLVDPAETTYTALSPTFPETTTRKRSRASLNIESYGAAFKVAQSNASSATRIYGIEADVAMEEGSQLA